MSGKKPWEEALFNVQRSSRVTTPIQIVYFVASKILFSDLVR